MSFLDEVTYNVKPGQEVPDTVKDDDVVNIGEKKKDHDGDGDIDSDDYLAARDKAIKKAMGKKVEEGKASKFLGALGVAAALLAVGQSNKSDSVLKAIDAKIEMADSPAEKAALKKLANQRLIWLDTGKGPGGDIKASDVGDVLKELAEKTCGCGQIPCKTYGKMQEKEDKTVELPADTTFTLDLKHLMKKHMDEGKSQEDVVKLTKALMKKLHDKGEVTVKGTKVLFKEMTASSDYDALYSYLRNNTRVDPDSISNKLDNMTDDQIKAALQKVRMQKELARPPKSLGIASTNKEKLANLSPEERKKYLKDLEKFSDFENIDLGGMDELDAPQDAQLALPEPDAPDFLGSDGMDYEGGMAKSQMLKMKNYAKALCDMIDDESQLEAWVQAKLTKASDYMSSVYHYLDYQQSKMNDE